MNFARVLFFAKSLYNAEFQIIIQTDATWKLLCMLNKIFKYKAKMSTVQS